MGEGSILGQTLIKVETNNVKRMMKMVQKWDLKVFRFPLQLHTGAQFKRTNHKTQNSRNIWTQMRFSNVYAASLVIGVPLWETFNFFQPQLPGYPKNLKSSLRRCSVTNGVLRSFAKFTCLRPATLLKIRLWHRCFPVNFAKFLRTPFVTEHVWTTASKISSFPFPNGCNQ